MTNINGIQKMIVGSKDYELIQQMMGNKEGSKVNDEETLFKTMQYYEMTNCSDAWSADAQSLSVEELIGLWQDFDKEETSFAQDFDEFDAFLTTYKKEDPTPPPPPPPGEDPVRPYVPNPNLTDEQKNRMNEFDTMRANDIHSKLCQDGDYELLLEYVRQREGSTLLGQSYYDSTGALTEAGKAKEAEMVKKLAELDTSENTLGTVMEEFLNFYGIKEPGPLAANGLVEASAVINDMLAGATKEIAIGGNKYAITNNGKNGNELSYEVKTNEKGEKYIAMTGNDWRIQDISGINQTDYIQVVGSRNEVDMAMGDDIAHLIGEENRALMGTGNDKVYIEGDGNFTDLWRGDDKLFNINGNNTMGLGFTGNDNFYVAGENVIVNGESNTGIGDGLYEDGIVAGFGIENQPLTPPDWFKDATTEVPEIFEITEDGVFEFNGIKYEVYKKFGTPASDKITYYKDENDRTIFESDGWNITVIEAMNTTGDRNYANVVITGNGNSYFGSNGEDIVEVRGDKNNIHGDASDIMGGDDKIFITSGTSNIVYGEAGNDEVNTSTSGNIFNNAIKDVEILNKSSLEEVVEEYSYWDKVETPTTSHVSKMNLIAETFGLPEDTAFTDLKERDKTLSMNLGKDNYVADVYNDTGKVKSITQKKDGNVSEVAEFVYSGESMTATIRTNYSNNTTSLENVQGYKITTTYDDVSSDNKKPQETVKTDDNGNVMFKRSYDYNDNRVWTTYADGSYSIAKYTNLNSDGSMLEKVDYYKPDGTLDKTEEFEPTSSDNVIDDTVDAATKQELIDLYNSTNDPKLKEQIKEQAKNLGFDIE